MFTAIIDADPIQQFVTNASCIVDEARLHLSEDGIELRAVDDANVGMLAEHLYTPVFESFKTDEHELGVNLTRLEDLLAFAEAGDLVKLTYKEETRKLHVTISGLEYTMALIDPESLRAEPDIPNLDLPASPKFEWGHMKRAIRAADMVSDHIRILVDDEAELFQVEASGDTDDVFLELDADDFEQESEFDGPANTLISLDYLQAIRDAIDSDAPVRFSVGNEWPINIEWAYTTGGGNVSFMIAPRIEND